jgi:hypothetical protein
MILASGSHGHGVHEHIGNPDPKELPLEPERMVANVFLDDLFVPGAEGINNRLVMADRCFELLRFAPPAQKTYRRE